MTHPDKFWNAQLKQKGPKAITREWNRPIVAALTVLTVIAALTGLFADLQLASRGLTTACYAAAALSGSVLLAFLFIKRLWVPRRSG